MIKNKVSLLLILAIAACSRVDTPNEDRALDNHPPQRISAISSDGTKTTLVGNNVVWTPNDRLSVFVRNGVNNKYLIDQTISDNTAAATFSLEAIGEPSAVLLDRNYAVYPYRDAENAVSADGIVTTLIKTNQNSTQSKMLACAPMIAVSDNYEFVFRNVASVLRFNLKIDNSFVDDCILNRIDITSATSPLSGKFSVNTNDEVWRTVPLTTTTTKTVSLYGSGIDVELNPQPQSFCIIVPPKVYPPHDLTFKVTYLGSDGQSHVKSITWPHELSLSPNSIQDINIVLSDNQGDMQVVTGGAYVINGHAHISCYSASLTGMVVGDHDEVGVLYQRINMTPESLAALTLQNVGQMGASNKIFNSTNCIKKLALEIAAGEDVIAKLTNLAGGDVSSDYIYRFYALNDGVPVYGDVQTFTTDTYGRYIPISAGTFTMGADQGEYGYNLEHLTSPSHNVTLTHDFEIGKYEVTVPEYAEFLNAVNAVPEVNTSTKLTVKINGKWAYYGSVDDESGSEEGLSLKYSDGVWMSENQRKKYPIERVSYSGALAYCEWLTDSRNDGYLYRLPTEAEWEYAARGGQNSRGYKYSGSENYEKVANYKTSTSGWLSIKPIGQKYPNELGLYDMSGNLWEFVGDRSDYNWNSNNGLAGFYRYCENGITDPVGPDTSIGTFEDDTFYCVKKGGSANESAGSSAFCPGFRRIDGRSKTHHHTTGGFRVVKVRNI